MEPHTKCSLMISANEQCRNSAERTRAKTCSNSEALRSKVAKGGPRVRFHDAHIRLAQAWVTFHRRSATLLHHVLLCTITHGCIYMASPSCVRALARRSRV